MVTIVRIVMILLGLVGVAAFVGLIIGLVQLLTKKNTAAAEEPIMQQPVSDQHSYFDGNTLQLIGIRILSGLLTGITLGLAYPWAMCMSVRWEVKHTVINGRRLRFTGTGGQLFGRYILWVLLTLITFGIYSIWFSLGMKKWVVRHTVYADDPAPAEGQFTGGAGGYLAMNLLYGLFCLITLGFGSPWARTMYLRWEAKHTHIGGTQLIFKGSGVQFIGQYLLLLLLTPITLGIYGLCFPVKLLKWQYTHTQAVPDDSAAAKAASGGVSSGMLMGICGGTLAFVLVVFAVIAIFIPAGSMRPAEETRTRTAILYGSGDCVLSYRDASKLYSRSWSAEDYRDIDGNSFYFDSDEYGIYREQFQVNGTIGTTACLDTDTNTLYLDLAIESTDIDVYLTLDKDQTDSGNAEPLTGIMDDSGSISSIPYSYDTAPKYVTVMGVLYDDGTYYFVVIHQQRLEVVVGTTEELTRQGLLPGQQTSAPVTENASIVGKWQYAVLDSYVPKQSVEAGHWTFRADGTFTTYYMGYLYSQDAGWSGAMGSSENTGTYTFDGTTLTMNYDPVQSPDGWTAGGYTETEIVRIDGNIMSIARSDFQFMIKDAGLEDVLVYIDSNSAAPIGTWYMIAEPQYHSIANAYQTNGCYYELSPNGSFYYMSLALAQSNDGWHHMGGGEDFYSGYWSYDGTTLTLHYTVHHQRYYDEQLGSENTRPVLCDTVETYTVDLSGTGSVPFTHDRLGQLSTVQKHTDTTTSAVDAMIQYCNANF